MAKWVFEPGHTAAGFCVRHMMVTWVRGHFKNVTGWMEFDPADPPRARVEGVIQAGGIWTGEPDRDAHLKGADFLDAANHPTILFPSSRVEQTGCNQYQVYGNLSIRGVTRPVSLDVTHLGQWQTPFWEGAVEKGPVTRAGFTATTRINRHHVGVSWNGSLDRGGLVVGNDVQITLDIEAILEKR
jgi:polyisoprenoid-binding protein YceI